jgi:hypothetical protein
MAASFLFAALTCAATVSAHGYVSSVTANGETHKGYNPAVGPWQPDQVRHLFRSQRGDPIHLRAPGLTSRRN